MSTKKLELRVAEVTYEDRIDEYEIASLDNIQGRDLLVQHLSGDSAWKSIRVRAIPGDVSGATRVIRKIEPAK